MFNKHSDNGIIYYTSSLFDQHGIKHFFAGKSGGVSTGCFESLNVSISRKDKNGQVDTRENVFENIKRALKHIDSVPHNSITTRQVHKANVFTPDDTYAGFGTMPTMPQVEDCDAVFIPGNLPFPDTACIKTADCVPILLADKATGSVCAVHAGWKGTVADIITQAISTMNTNPENILCAIGPSIKSCCYQVSSDVYDAVNKLFTEKGIQNLMPQVFKKKFSFLKKSKKFYCDLSLINYHLLINNGVKSENIDVCPLCTCCAKDENGKNIFFSHRAAKGYSGTGLSAIKRFKV